MFHNQQESMFCVHAEVVKILIFASRLSFIPSVKSELSILIYNKSLESDKTIEDIQQLSIKSKLESNDIKWRVVDNRKNKMWPNVIKPSHTGLNTQLEK